MNTFKLLPILRRHKKLSILFIILMLLNVIIYVIITDYRQNEIAKLHSTSLKTGKARLAESSAPTDAWFEVQSDIKTFKRQLPVMSAIIDRAKELKDVLNRNHLSATKIMLRPERTELLALWKYTGALKITGPYKRLKSLLADIQKSPHLFCIESLTLINQSQKTEKVVMELRLATYFRDEQTIK
jgi:Tfp pilus assembly protein PilO